MGKKMQGWGEKIQGGQKKLKGKKDKKEEKGKKSRKIIQKVQFFLQNDDPTMKNVGRGWHNEVHNEKNKCNEKNLSIFIHMQA